MRLMALYLAMMVTSTAGKAQVARAGTSQSPVAAANAWMKTPTDAKLSDDVPGNVRAERDTVWDGLIGTPYPLTPDEAPHHGISEGAIGGELSQIPEIANVPYRSVLIGRFAAFRSVLTASNRAVYTEATIDIDSTFEDASGLAHPNGRLTIIFPGGTVRTTAGQTISYLTQPRSYFMKPGGTYLLVLAFHPDGSFYGLANDWDLSDGTVRANSGIDRMREQRALSTFIGLTRDQLVSALNARFSRK